MFPHQRSEFYVYVHRRADTGAVFYVGKGWGLRGLAFNDRTPEWDAARAGCEVVAEVVEHSLTEDRALDLEADLIDFILDCGGRLTNLRRLPEQRERSARKIQAIAHRSNVREARWMAKTIQHPPYSIRCLDTGDVHATADDAAKWLESTGRGTVHPNLVIRALRGGTRKAGGLRWEPA